MDKIIKMFMHNTYYIMIFTFIIDLYIIMQILLIKRQTLNVDF